MDSKLILPIFMALSSAMIISCASQNHGETQALQKSGKNYGLSSSAEILLTSEAGVKMSLMDNQTFGTSDTSGNQVVIRPDIIKQTISGIGTSFTESSAYALAHLDPDRRGEVMKNCMPKQEQIFHSPERRQAQRTFQSRGNAPMPRSMEIQSLSILISLPIMTAFPENNIPVFGMSHSTCCQ